MLAGVLITAGALTFATVATPLRGLTMLDSVAASYDAGKHQVAIPHGLAGCV
jgi:hypothetical protein